MTLNFSRLILPLIALTCLSCSAFAAVKSSGNTHFNVKLKPTIDLVELEKLLKTEGVVGYIHGAIEQRNVAVFTYRNPQDFFDNVQLPLTSRDPAINAQILKSKRNQKVRLFGQFIMNGAPIRHIDATKMELVQDYTSELDAKPNTYKTTDAEYAQNTELIGRVHAIDRGGKVLVIEYKDLVTPVFVTAPIDIQVVQSLYRGDRVSLSYRVRAHPGAPIHLSPVPKDPTQSSITVLERIKDMHEKKISQEGYLVKFPKSPQISFDVYAVLKEDAEGTNVQFTLVNFTDAEMFKKLREKLEAAWNANTSSVENGRNKLINKGVRIRASGTGNVQDPSQANGQILIEKLEDVEIL